MFPDLAVISCSGPHLHEDAAALLPGGLLSTLRQASPDHPGPPPPLVEGQTAREVVFNLIEGIQPDCPIIGRLVQLTRAEGSIQIQLCELVGELQQALLMAAPEDERPRIERGTTRRGRSVRIFNRIRHHSLC